MMDESERIDDLGVLALMKDVNDSVIESINRGCVEFNLSEIDEERIARSISTLESQIELGAHLWYRCQCCDEAITCQACGRKASHEEVEAGGFSKCQGGFSYE